MSGQLGDCHHFWVVGATEKCLNNYSIHLTMSSCGNQQDEADTASPEQVLMTRETAIRRRDSSALTAQC
jgi:hypothetical protein